MGIGHYLDRAIGVFAPKWALHRIAARASMSQIEAFTGAGQGGYDAGKLNRLTRSSLGTTADENSIPRAQIDRVRSRSWDLFRNNPHARKIVRTICAKVAVLHPQSQAKNDDGTPNVEFRAKAQELFGEWRKCCDYRGRPGFGGQTLDGTAKTALTSVILSGETLYRARPTSTDEQAEYGLPVPLQVQLINSDRLAEMVDAGPTSGVFAGIETDADGRRIAYHLTPATLGQLTPAVSTETQKVAADEICHLYISDDIDQMRGVPWFAPSLNQMRDTGDYQYNELKASALGACVTLGVRRPQGVASFGAESPSDWDLTDADGNRITTMQPGMIVDLGTDGEIQGFNPQRPSQSAELFIQHMLRTTAAGIPGIKGSTLTGDYRGSSFSSERSADNDVWPELEDLQNWFGASFYQPLYEAVIKAGIESGYFGDSVSAAEFIARPHDFLCCLWQGPVPRSINPTDDALGAKERIGCGVSSPPIECAKVGLNWRDVIKSTSEFVEYARALKLDENLISQLAGLNPKVVVADVNASAPPSGPDGTAPVVNGANRLLFNGGLNGHQNS